MLQSVAESAQFYDAIAASYSRELEARANYITRVNKLIIDNLKSYTRPLKVIDIGCGNGERAKIIGLEVPEARIIGMDCSREMVREATNNIDVVYDDIAEELDPDTILEFGQSEISLCLWNVLGHIESSRRLPAIKNIARLLQPGGKLFMDVNNRHNRKAYGFRAALRNSALDLVAPDDSRGDFTITREVSGRSITGKTHIFSYKELRKLLANAGFRIINVKSINYDSGEIEQFKSSGQLYIVAEKSDESP